MKCLKHSKTIAALSGAVLLGALLSVYVPASAGNSLYRLPVFETSDLHGYLAETSGGQKEYRLAYIADKVRDDRSDTGTYRKETALLLDGGDIFQGNTASNFLKGSSMSAAFIRMDYDAAALGNHEFDWGVHTVIDDDATLLDAQFEETAEINDVPVVCCNIYYKREKAPFTRDYVIVEKIARDANGQEIPVKIGVIGFSEDYASSILETQFTGAGFTTLVNYGMAERIARELEESCACDATVLLTHGAAAAAAENLGGSTVFDLVLGGHTHRSESGKTAGGLVYMQPAANGTAYCRAEICFAVENGRPVFQTVESAQCISTTDAHSRMIPSEENASELDPDVSELTDRVLLEIEDLLETRVGYITESIRKSDTLPNSGGRATSAGNWMASIIQRSVGADVGFMNSGGIRTEFPLTGFGWNRTITASDVYTMFPFGNRIYCYEVTYRDLLELLQYALTSSGSSLFSYMVGIDCYYVGSRVQALAVDHKGIYVNGVWVGDWADRTVKVAASEFLATTNRPDGRLSNPLVRWNRTDKLIAYDVIDTEGAFRVLDEESAANHWELKVDRQAHLIAGTFAGEQWTPADEPDTAEETAPEGQNELKAPDKTMWHGMTILLAVAAVLLIGGILTFVLMSRSLRGKKKEEIG